jgi:hypothetical protein
VTRSPKLRIFLAVAVIASAGLAAAAAAAFEVGPFEPALAPTGPVVATVNGQPIYLGEARSRIEGLGSVHGDIEDVFGPQWQDRILDSLVEDHLIRAEASARGIVVTDDELAAHVERLQQSFGSEEQFDAWLREQGIDVTELERRISLQTVAAGVYEAITADVRIEAAEVRDYYRTHRDEFVQADGSTAELWAVKDAIRDDLLKKAKDTAFGAWLEEARSTANVVVVMDGWWGDL